MNLEARVTSIWRKQKLFIAVFLIGFGAYFFFDGAIAWPRSNERFLKHQEFRDADNLAGWTAYAKERGWSNKPPEKLYKQDELQAQFVYAAICVILGLVAFGYWLQQVGRTIKLDDEAVTSPAGTRIPFDSITGLGLKKWDSKGLATVRYELEGRKGEFIVDDYKFDPIATHEILNELKRRLESRTHSI
jgi:hypothetical protein